MSAVRAASLPSGLALFEEIGRGAGSVVHRGVRDGHEYAVKLLRDGDGDAGTAFRREAATLARLEHPALPRIHEVGDAAGRPYLVMDLARGGSLCGFPRRGEEAVLATLAADVAGALAVAHRAGVVHRDVKPANILVTDDDHAQLVDFGLAATAGGVAGEVAAGTLLYSAPEQTGMLHRAVDGRADLYALGAVLFECLAGHPPFTARDAGEMVRMHLSAPVPALPATVSDEFAAVVGRLLAKDPDDRYQSAAGLRHDLLRLARRDLDGWRLGEADGPARADLDLVGRDEQAGTLLRRWNRGTGGVVLISGAPGSGKSRLVRELTEAVRRSGRPVLHGKATGEDAPLAALRQLTDQVVADARRRPPGEREAATDRLRAAAGRTAPVLRPLSGALTDLLGLDDTGQSADERQFAEAVAAFLAGLAGDDGAVLHLDDAQWFDPGTTQVLARLAARLPESRLLVVLTARDDPAGAAAVAEVAAACGDALDTRLSVGPLDRAAIARLLTTLLGGGVAPADLVDRLAARSGGNPLAAQEYVRAVVDAGLLTPHWGRWRLDTAGLDALKLPGDVLDLVVRRADRLGAAGRDLLTVAACCGARFDLPLVATAAGAGPGAVADAFAEATALQLVEAAPDGGMVFLHDRIREALLARVGPDDLRRLHTRIAAALEASPGADPYAVARHYLAGDLATTAAAAYRAAGAAGLRALADHSPTEAFAFLDKTMELAAPAGREPGPELHAALAQAASLTGRYTTADDHFAMALAAEKDPLRRAGYCRDQAHSYQQRSEPGKGLVAVRRGLGEIGYVLPARTGTLLLAALWALLRGIVVGKLPERRRLVTGHRREILEMRSSLLSVAALSAGASLRMHEVVAFDCLALPLVHRIGPGAVYSVVLGGLNIAARAAGLRRPAEAMLRRSEQAAHLSGDPAVLGLHGFGLAISYELLPPMTAGTGARLRDILDEYGPLMNVGDRLHVYSGLARMLLLRGHVGAAETVYRRGLTVAGSADNAFGSAFAGVGAQLAAAAGDRAAAGAELRAVRAYADGLAENVTQLITYGVAALDVAAQHGETGPDADRLIDEFRALPVPPPMLLSSQKPVWLAIADIRLTQLAAAGPDDRQRRLRQARVALRELRRFGRGPVLGAYHDVARARLAQLTGDHRGALRRLAAVSVRSGGLDVPLLHIEIARVQARAWAALGCLDDADRAAVQAHALAVRHGWRARAAAVRVEFGLERAASAETAAGGPTRTYALRDHRRLAALQEVSLASASVLEPAALVRVALDEIVRIFAAERAFLFLTEDDTLRPFLGRDADGAELTELTEYGSTLVDRVRAEGTALVTTGGDRGAALGSESAVVHGLRSIMVAPLLLKGRLLGVIYLDSRVATGIFTGDDVDLLAAITAHVAASLETARVAQLEVAVRAAERERDVADSLRDALAELTESLDPAGVHEVLIRRMSAALPGARVELSTEAPDFSGEVRHGTDGDVAWLAAPLRLRGEDRGVVRAVRDGRPFTETEAKMAAALAGQAATALDNATLFQRTQELALRDGLTGLLNRRSFHEIGDRQVRADVRARRPVGVLMLDIDHFKAVNDTHGHAAGDEVIRAVADRLSGVLRDTDVLGRYGGEEFAVVLTGPAAGSAGMVAERLRAAVADRPVLTPAGPLTVTVSVGVLADASPSDRLRLPDALHVADGALYEAKRAGRNRCVLRVNDDAGGRTSAML